MRPSKKTRLLPKQRGFSLVELLIVVVLIGLGAYIGTIAVTNFIQKQRLTTATSELRAFLQEIPNQVTREQTPLYVHYLAATASSPAQFRVTRDQAGTQVVRSYTLLREIAVETISWPALGSGRALRCDTLFRTTDPTTNVQVPLTHVMRLTHSRMLSGQLKPKRSYDIAITPVWSVASKVVY